MWLVYSSYLLHSLILNNCGNFWQQIKSSQMAIVASSSVLAWLHCMHLCSWILWVAFFCMYYITTCISQYEIMDFIFHAPQWHHIQDSLPPSPSIYLLAITSCFVSWHVSCEFQCVVECVYEAVLKITEFPDWKWLKLATKQLNKHPLVTSDFIQANHMSIKFQPVSC